MNAKELQRLRDLTAQRDVLAEHARYQDAIALDENIRELIDEGTINRPEDIGVNSKLLSDELAEAHMMLGYMRR